MKKIIAVFTVFFLSLQVSLLHSQVFMTLGPEVMINTDSSKNSAPSPIMFSGGLGADFFEKSPVTAECRLSFFTNYYIWDGEDAQPAEIENRTAIALSLMLDMTAGHNFNFGKNSILVAAGAGFLARYGLLALGVDSGDLNPKTGSKASDDVSDINSWFYKNVNFLYPEISITYMREIPKGMKAGCEFRAYFPLGSMMNGDGIDGMIYSLSLKVSFPKIERRQKVRK